jgi:membrane protein required for beta-lactamase induction
VIDCETSLLFFFEKLDNCEHTTFELLAMVALSDDKQARPEHADHVEIHWKENAVHEKELRDAEALREVAPEIPLREVLEAHGDEDSRAVKKLMRKVDFRLITILALIYIWAYIDRSNLGNVCALPDISGNHTIASR